MATYKVIQDIEAEDKLVGPLSLRQFIYAAIVAVSGFIAFKLAIVAWWLAIPFIPHMILFAVLAAPFGHDQSSEIWLLAKIRFFLKPRRRIWDQSGAKQLVTITAPKKIERMLTNNLSQTEVRSRLHALANTIDSRGWAVKNVNVNMFTQPSYVAAQTSDRLIDPSSIPQEVPSFEVSATDDMLDERNNPTAQNLDKMIQASAQNHREELMSRMQQTAAAPATLSPQQKPPADYWFMNGTSGQAQAPKPGYATFDHNPLVAPGTQASNTSSSVTPTDPDEEALLKKIHEEQEKPNPMHSHLRTIEPLEVQRKHEAEKQRKEAEEWAKKAAMNRTPDPAILELASNDDLNVATIARQANKAKPSELSDGEVVINLHS